MMRKLLGGATAVALAVLLAACGSNSAGGTGSGTGASGASSTTTAAAGCTVSGLQHLLYQPGVLTVATDKPAYTPWFENNDPSNGKGYESAVAYAVAKQLGFAKYQVKWAYEPFNNSYAPGPKHFDFDINEISVTPQRAQAVTFSTSYYNVDQALVALKGTKITTAHSPADLKTYVYGDQVGTTSLSFINNAIKPTAQVKVYESLNDVKQALQTHQIDAFVTDTPTAQYISSSEIPHSTMVGQFTGSGEHYGLLFAKGNHLVSCVDKALTTLTQNGTLHKLQQQYLKIYLSVPTLKP